nr:ethylene-responsive transcription factor 6-like [Lolium perenne]
MPRARKPTTRKLQPPACRSTSTTRVSFHLCLPRRARAAAPPPPPRCLPAVAPPPATAAKRPSGHFDAEIHSGEERIRLGTFEAAHEAARAYDAVAWRLGRSSRTMNFDDVWMQAPSPGASAAPAAQSTAGVEVASCISQPPVSRSSCGQDASCISQPPSRSRGPEHFFQFILLF